MTFSTKIFVWTGVIALIALAIFFLRDVLPPFLLGAGAAYFLDPLCNRLERRGFSRTVSTCIVTAAFFALVLTAAALTLPVLITELRGLLRKLPDYIDATRALALSLANTAQNNPFGLDVTSWARQFNGAAADLFNDTAKIAPTLLGGVVNFLSATITLILTPVVTFYMLRDWGQMVGHIESWIPRANLKTARILAHDADKVLGGFVRGQVLVCLTLGLFYALGLTLAGLEFGFIIGLATGVLSFIPWFGMLLGFGLGMAVAALQFGDWLPIAIVAGVFGAGQILEGYFLTPRMVGHRVGLHPVWVLFALMAGGNLIGFSGMLVAVPLAAVCGVAVRFLLTRYRSSTVYNTLGAHPGGDPPSPPR